MWTFKRRGRSVRPGTILRIQTAAPFRLRWTDDEWAGVEDAASRPTALGIEFVDLAIARLQAAPIRFTFFWPEVERWEGRDFAIAVETPDRRAASPMTHQIGLAPSCSGRTDFACLGEEVGQAEAGGADRIHVDA